VTLNNAAAAQAEMTEAMEAKRKAEGRCIKFPSDVS
jgi:hypothetical protein